MSRIFFTSDPHFLHDLVAKTRGYESAEEHDAVLIETINKTVTKRDTLWITGDLSMSSVTNTLDMVSKLNGVKRLVAGNHDSIHPLHKGSHNKMRRYLEVFDSVHLAEQLSLGGQKFNLSHFPYKGDHKPEERYVNWRLPVSNIPLICGHIHQEWNLINEPENDLWQLNVGADHRFSPFSSDEVRAMWDARNG